MNSTDIASLSAYELLFEEYRDAYGHASDELVSTPGCEADSTHPAELLLSILTAQHKLGHSTMLRTVLHVIAWAEENGSPQAAALIEELSGTLAQWQVQLLREQGAL